MAITHTINMSWSGSNGRSISQQVQITGAGETNFDETIAASAANSPVPFACPHAILDSFWMVSDIPVTCYVNAPSTGSPLFSIALAANVPYLWHNLSLLASPFTADITGLYFTNPSGTLAAHVNIRAVRN